MAGPQPGQPSIGALPPSPAHPGTRVSPLLRSFLGRRFECCCRAFLAESKLGKEAVAELFFRFRDKPPVPAESFVTRKEKGFFSCQGITEINATLQHILLSMSMGLSAIPDFLVDLACHRLPATKDALLWEYESPHDLAKCPIVGHFKGTSWPADPPSSLRRWRRRGGGDSSPSSPRSWIRSSKRHPLSTH